MAQKTTIKFESNRSWQEVQAKAKSENKLIFLDCYATWCGPCKWMDQEIFTKPDVVDYFNAHFINVKLQMDKTSKDDASVRKTYTTADSLSRLYKIGAYPTYLFFSADGQAEHELVGTSSSISGFLTKVEGVLDSNLQYFTLLRGWQDHQNDSTYLLRSITAARNAGADEQAKAIANSYIKSLHSPVTKQNIELIEPLIGSETDEAFQLCLQNAAKINELQGTKGYVEDKLSGIIFKEEVAPVLIRKDATINWTSISGQIIAKYATLDNALFAEAMQQSLLIFIGKEIKESISKKKLQSEDWRKISGTLKKRFQGYNCDEMLLGIEMQYYFERKLWAQCAGAAILVIDQYKSPLIQKYPDQQKRKLIMRFINDVTWKCIFQHGANKGVLNRALKHLEDLVNIEHDEDINDIDTYANLLYKTGHTQIAIEWEKKIIDTATKQNVSAADFRSNLEKMQQGKATWEVAL